MPATILSYYSIFSIEKGNDNWNFKESFQDAKVIGNFRKM